MKIQPKPSPLAKFSVTASPSGASEPVVPELRDLFDPLLELASTANLMADAARGGAYEALKAQNSAPAIKEG
jgi:hypothetical protein